MIIGPLAGRLFPTVAWSDCGALELTGGAACNFANPSSLSICLPFIGMADGASGALRRTFSVGFETKLSAKRERRRFGTLTVASKRIAATPPTHATPAQRWPRTARRVRRRAGKTLLD